jgi:O-methyltransferase
MPLGSATSSLFAPVAQLVERRLPKPKVAGSTPVWRFVGSARRRYDREVAGEKALLRDRVVAPARHRLRRARLAPLSRRVIDDDLTYLGVEKMRTLERLMGSIRRIPGDVMEAGVALGGSAVALCGLMGAGRAFHGYDVFGMIPPPGPKDPPEVHERYRIIREGRSAGIGGKPYYGYVDDLYDKVVATFERYGQPVDGRRVQLHRGLFEHTLVPTGPVALAHIDCDWYEPVALCLRRIWPHLSQGGYVVLDDYNDYGGCAEAVADFRGATPAAELTQTAPNAVLHKVA